MNIDQLLKSKIRDIPDFPKPGIIFKDITPILQDPQVFKKVVDAFAERYSGKKVDVFVGIESRGFIFGAPLAYELGASFVPVRKVGKLPYKTVQESYDLEYGSATVEMHVDAVHKGQRVVVIDDLLATGGTANATCRLLEKQGAHVLECAFVVELGFLEGRKKLPGRDIFSLVRY
ncbi:MAG: adenine phosphoribosyltransferase [Deltaproteobacteria bacterium]|nr:adenine phosphoribosyltransferase [Deltaproteobacteria bacterium]MDZ4225080.1 adenine phosphoribosyltransferase [bacterium]